MTTVPIESPCIRVCVLDSLTDQCVGCGRLRSEIAGWRAMSVEDRRTVMSTLPERLRDMTRRKLRGGRVGRNAMEAPRDDQTRNETVTPDAPSR